MGNKNDWEIKQNAKEQAILSVAAQYFWQQYLSLTNTKVTGEDCYSYNKLAVQLQNWFRKICKGLEGGSQSQ